MDSNKSFLFRLSIMATLWLSSNHKDPPPDSINVDSRSTALFFVLHCGHYLNPSSLTKSSFYEKRNHFPATALGDR
jgi:hypothetical protein